MMLDVEAATSHLVFRLKKRSADIFIPTATISDRGRDAGPAPCRQYIYDVDGTDPADVTRARSRVGGSNGCAEFAGSSSVIILYRPEPHWRARDAPHPRRLC
jgi:hypothetical protein